MLQQEKEQVF